MRELLRRKLTDSLKSAPPPFTRRDIRLPAVPGKALAVIGMRRSGKTTFLWQCLADRLAAGTPREALVYLNVEDDRLENLKVADLSWLVEEYFRLQPGLRDRHRVTFFLDEIQTVPGWEKFARRILDTERVDLFFSGSSAKLLSREVATSMRGRALEVLVHPFSFREALRHSGLEPQELWDHLSPADRSDLDARLRAWLAQGGFPEVQGAAPSDRAALLRSYVDVAVLRDVIERHGVSNPVALRWMQRHLLASAAGQFSVQKFHDDLKSQGVPVSKDALHAYLGYLEDAFLIRTVSLHTASERRRRVNLRKAYPIDTGLIALYERSGRANAGHALETAVLLELERRGCDVEYVRTSEGWEVDFFASAPGARPRLIQVCADISDPATFDREVRALVSASAQFSEARAVLVTLDADPPERPLPKPIHWRPAAAWLLDTSI